MLGMDTRFGELLKNYIQKQRFGKPIPRIMINEIYISMLIVADLRL